MSKQSGSVSSHTGGLWPFVVLALPSLAYLVFHWLKAQVAVGTSLWRLSDLLMWVGVFSPLCFIVLLAFWVARPPQGVRGVTFALLLSGLTAYVSWQAVVFLIVLFVGAPL